MVGTLQPDRNLVGQNENEHAMGAIHGVSPSVMNDNDNDDDGEHDQLKCVEGITNHVPIAPPPLPAPEELMEEFMFGAASGGVGSAFITSGVRGVGDAVPPSRQEAGMFGPNQLDYRLNSPDIMASWAQASTAEDDPPVPVWASVSDDRILGESSRGAVRAVLPAEHGSTLWEAARLLAVYQ
jgi:hypothetical protein